MSTHGVHHVGLTVADLAAARSFFVTQLGYELVAERPEYPAAFVSDGTTLLTLWQANEGARPFDRKRNIGLHHLALRVDDLDALASRLGLLDDCEIEFGPEPLGTLGVRHMMFRGPGGLRLELVAP